MRNYQKFNILSRKAALIAIVFIQFIFIYYNFLSRYSTNVNKITILKNKIKMEASFILSIIF